MSILSKEECKSIKHAGGILRECLGVLSKAVKPGISTKTLEKIANEVIALHNAKPAFKGYRGFPASICVSRNNVVVHGMPGEKEMLEAGDIVSIDVGVEYEGFFADGAKTFAVGKISRLAGRLIRVTEKALYKGIEKARPENRVGDISWAIQSFVEANNFSVVRAFVGHGIGRKIHEEPEVPNFGKPNQGMILADGMALAIEPMVNAGQSDVRILKDGWTAVTKDGNLSAHFEHTVIVRGKKPEIVT